MIGILLILVLLLSIEGAIHAYEFINPPNCSILKSDSYKNLGPLKIRQICSDIQNIVYINSAILTLKPNQHMSTININSAGFRGGEITKEKASGFFRIFVVGGSTTFGAGSSSDETTIPAFLQEEFSTHNFTHVEVINAGLPWADSSWESYYIKKKLIDYNPDLFIVYDGWNDAVHRRLVDPVDKEEKKSFWQFFKFSNYPSYRTPFYLYQLFHPTEGQETVVGNDKISDVTSKWKERWINICDLGKEQNFKTIIIVQPLVGTGHKILTKYEESIDMPKIELTALDQMANSLPELNSVCDKTADFRDSYNNISEPVFFDPGHMNDDGNKIIAERMFELSEPLVSAH